MKTGLKRKLQLCLVHVHFTLMSLCASIEIKGDKHFHH